MSYVRIVNQRKGGNRPKPGELVIPADRTDPVLGNRHVLKDPNNREERAKVLRLHAEDEEADRAADGPITRRLREITEIVESGQPVAFVCWCFPEECHTMRYRQRISHALGRDMRPQDERDLEASLQKPTEQGSLF